MCVCVHPVALYSLAGDGRRGTRIILLLFPSFGVVSVMHLWRRLSSSFALSAVLTLALGIGASTAMFGIFRAVLLNPIPFADPERVVTIQPRFPSIGRTGTRMTGGDLTDIVQLNDVFDS